MCDEVKESTVRKIRMHIFDPTLPVCLLCNACSTDLACAWHQLLNGDVVPVLFGGRALSTPEFALHPSELELMAVAERVAKFRLGIEDSATATRVYVD